MAELTKEQIAKFDTINVIELPDKTMYRLESVSSKGDPLITQTIKSGDTEHAPSADALYKVLGDEKVTDLISRLSEFEKAVDNKQDKLKFDDTHTLGSKNVVYSDGIYNAIKNNKPDLSDYAKKSDLQGLATEQWVNDKGYLTEHQSLDSYVTKTELASKCYSIETVTPAADTEYTLNSTQYLRIIPAAAVKLTFNRLDNTVLMKEYHIVIDCNTAVPTTEFNEVLWELDNDPVFEKGKFYDIVIRDDGDNLYGSWKAYKLMPITILITTSDAAAVQLNGTTYNLVTGDNSLTDSGFKTITDIGGFSSNNKITSIDFGDATLKIETLDSKFSNMSNLTKISNINVKDVVSPYNVFNSDKQLKEIDTSNWDVSKATNFYSMFEGCGALTSLDLSRWNTSSATNFSKMFNGCTKLKTLDISDWNTSKVTGFSWVFSGCSGLKTLNVSDWDTSSATNFSTMFRGCRGLTSLDVSGWNTSSATNFSYMFSDCSGLTTLDVSNWDVSSATDFAAMFYGCSGLTSLDVSGWNTSSATNFRIMFNGCRGLTSLDVSGWNTSSATNFSYMFSGCRGLTSLDVSGWNTSSATNFGNMFNGCHSLISLDLSGWNVSASANITDMFKDCNALTTIKMIGCSQATIDKITSVKPAFATIITK